MTRASPSSREAVEAAKQDNLGQLLLRAARLYDQEARRRVAAAGGELRPAWARLFPHIDWEGTRVTDLAARVGATKQAVGQTVAELEAAGLVVRRPDDDDGRARLVLFTAKGRRAMVHGLGVLRDLERDFEGAVGARALGALKQSLGRMVEVLERLEGAATDEPTRPAGPAAGRAATRRRTG